MTILALLILAAAGLFAVMNQPLLTQPQTVTIPGGTATVPLIGVLLAALAGAVLVLWLADAAAVGVWRGSAARLRRQLADRDRELLAVKSEDYDRVSDRIESLRRDLSDQIAAVARLIESRPVSTAVREERAGIIPPR